MSEGWPKEKPDLLFSGHGWLNEENRRTLRRFVPGARKIIEVGTWLGLSARFMADLAPQATVYCVDTWLGSYEHHENPDWSKFLPTLWDQFVVDCWDYRDRIVPVKMDSVEGMLQLFEDEQFPDIIYIDGGHRYDVVYGDIKTAMALWPTARLIGDDWGWEGVRRAVEELVPEDRLKVDGNCWWCEDGNT